jgi:hypothetical protein
MPYFNNYKKAGLIEDLKREILSFVAIVLPLHRAFDGQLRTTRSYPATSGKRNLRANHIIRVFRNQFRLPIDAPWTMFGAWLHSQKKTSPPFRPLIMRAASSPPRLKCASGSRRSKANGQENGRE